MRYYPRATAVDCYDNDLSGRLYGIRTAALASGLSLDIVRCDDCVRFNANGKAFSLPLNQVSSQEFMRRVPDVTRYAQQLPPKNFKDWNDVVMDRPFRETVTASKYQLYDRLRESRQNSFKR